MVVLLASRATLAAGPLWAHSTALTLHKGAFYGVLLAVTLHLVAHLAEAVRTTARDLLRRQHSLAPAARWRLAAIGASLLTAGLLTVALSGHAGPYLHHYPHR